MIKLEFTQQSHGRLAAASAGDARSVTQTGTETESRAEAAHYVPKVQIKQQTMGLGDG